jgi:hypothetical protein
MLYGFYKKISSWIAFRLERHILRPSLVALNYIGSGYARASIVDLYNAYDLASAKADMDDDLQRIDPTIDAQRQAIKGIKDFMPREGYKPEDLLTLIDYEDFPIEDIIMIAKIVAKEVTPLQLREFALRVRHKNNSIALKTLRAAAVITKYNLELREEWEVFTKTKLPAHLATLPSERRGQARFLSGIWDLLISCSLEAKIFVCVTLTILGVIFYGIKAKDMVLVLSSIAGLAANYIVAFLMARNKNTHIDK